MKKIGLLGGLGPESTSLYYRDIMAAFHSAGGPASYPEVVLYSADLGRMVNFMEQKDLAGMAAWASSKVRALKEAGVEFAAICCNSLHAVFDEIVWESSLPLISIVRESCKYMDQMGLKRPGLLGTGFTMTQGFFGREARKWGIEISVPPRNEQDFVDKKLFEEIELGVIKDSTRESLLDIIAKMKKEQNIDSVILGCTELPLILPDHALDIPFINTTALHVAAIVDECRR